MQKLAFEFCQHFNMSFTLMPISRGGLGSGGSGLRVIFCPTRQSQVCKASTR